VAPNLPVRVPEENNMTKMLEPMIAELGQEAVITKRILERVPADKLAWKPHAKSMSLGQLALHIANIPGGIARITKLEQFDVAAANFDPPEPRDAQEILLALEASIKSAEGYLGELSEAAAAEKWRLTANGKELSAIPRIEVLRTLMLNHWYHHRGQLSVYLRLLEVSVPVIYGRSADEGPLV
jgi:uncharacterized damage-inducible protein DinB